MLTLSHTDSGLGARHKAAEFFAARVARYTGSAVSVQVMHSGKLGNDPQALEKLSKGEIDFTLMASGVFASHVPQLEMAGLPYLVQTYEQGWRLYDRSVWLQKQFEALVPKGIRFLATWEAGFRSFTTNKPFPSPNSIKGGKVRIYANAIISSTMKGLGLEPIVMPVTEAYDAIADERVNGQENPVDTIYSLRFYEVASHVTLTRHIYSPLPFVMSEASWSKLSVDCKEAVLKAAREASAFSRRMVRNLEDFQVNEMRIKGANIVEPDATVWKASVQPVYAEARQRFGAELDALLNDASAA